MGEDASPGRTLTSAWADLVSRPIRPYLDCSSRIDAQEIDSSPLPLAHRAGIPVSEPFHGTTIVTVRRGAQVVMGGDGQVSLGNTVVKGNARKVRRLGKGHVLAGFRRRHRGCLHPVRTVRRRSWRSTAAT
jgi:hypothetical protein